MTDISAPAELDKHFATVLRATKADFVGEASIAQHGAVAIDASDFPGWPEALASADPVIETFVAVDDEVTALSDNEPFVSAWRPLVEWMNDRVRSALRTFDVELDGAAYATASLTATELLEGVAHMDDDTFVPTDTVSMVAIFGELAGPRIATESIEHQPLRAMSQVMFTDEQLESFAANEFDHCQCSADQLVLFPQFGQLHAGPAADIAHQAPTRQLLVYRAKVGIKV